MRTLDNPNTSDRLARSALARDQAVMGLDAYLAARADAATSMYTNVERVPLSALSDWYTDDATGAIRHVSGKFFSIQGVDVRIPNALVPHWDQPIILQPEVGILGILVKEINGVLHCLMQLKAEPGNYSGIQISPTVQATRSNYTRVHGGNAIPYLRYFMDRTKHRVVADVRQSEQGSWFLRKRNRNMVIEVTEDVEVVDGFHWLTIAQVNDLLGMDDMINMDTRSVLSCLPFIDMNAPGPMLGYDGFTRSQISSWTGEGAGLHSIGDLLSWITEQRAATEVTVEPMPLHKMTEWRYDGDVVSHLSARFFDVIGLLVEARGREVGRWNQPMLAARGIGLVAFLVTRVEGVLHVLVHAKAEPGIFDVAELAPTVQCVPENYADEPTASRPPFLDAVLDADPGRIKFDVIQSEEGGRFFHTRTRHVIVETDELHSHPDFRWMTPHQLTTLLQHSHYVNIQCRSLLACLRALASSTEVGA